MNAVLLLAFAVTGLVTSEPPAELAAATRAYDLPAAEKLATALEYDSRPENAMIRARTWLLVAELRRIEYEALPEDAIEERRTLGREIDAAADAGLDATDTLEECSEKHRIRADLLGTKVRSRYRAGKYKDAIDRAITMALERDPENARALVSRAKTHVLRPDADSDDLRRGQELLDHALALDASLEQAHVLQAYTWERLGEWERARAGYERCLERNGACGPAATGLKRVNAQRGSNSTITKMPL